MANKTSASSAPCSSSGYMTLNSNNCHRYPEIITEDEGIHSGPGCSSHFNYGTTSTVQENSTHRPYTRFMNFKSKSLDEDQNPAYRCCFGLIHVKHAVLFIATVKLVLIFSIFCRQLIRTVEIYSYSAVHRAKKSQNDGVEVILSNSSLRVLEDESNRTRAKHGVIYLSCASSLRFVDDESGDTPEDVLPALISTWFFTCEFMAALGLYAGLLRRRRRWLQFHIDLHVVSVFACTVVVGLLISVFVLTFTTRFAFPASSSATAESGENSKPQIPSVSYPRSSPQPELDNNSLSRRLCVFFQRHIAFGSLRNQKAFDDAVGDSNNDQEGQRELHETRSTRATVGVLGILICTYIGAEVWSFRIERACQTYVRNSHRCARSHWPKKRNGRGTTTLNNIRRRASLEYATSVINAETNGRATTIFGTPSLTDDSEALLPSGAREGNEPSPNISKIRQDEGPSGDVPTAAGYADDISSEDDDDGNGGDGEESDLVVSAKTSRDNSAQIHVNQCA